jgi:hypothetical protein
MATSLPFTSTILPSSSQVPTPTRTGFHVIFIDDNDTLASGEVPLP